VGDGEGLARPGNAQQHLVPLAVPQAAGQFGDGGRLVAGRRVIGNQFQGVSAGQGGTNYTTRIDFDDAELPAALRWGMTAFVNIEVD